MVACLQLALIWLTMQKNMIYRKGFCHLYIFIDFLTDDSVSDKYFDSPACSCSHSFFFFFFAIKRIIAVQYYYVLHFFYTRLRVHIMRGIRIEQYLAERFWSQPGVQRKRDDAFAIFCSYIPPTQPYYCTRASWVHDAMYSHATGQYERVSIKWRLRVQNSELWSPQFSSKWLEHEPTLKVVRLKRRD